LIFLAASFASAQVVTFGLPDYAELGELKERVLPAFQELSFATTNLKASLDYVDLLSQSVVGPDTTGIANAITSSASVINAGNSIKNAVGANSVEALAGSFSPIQTAPLQKALSDFRGHLSTLEAQVAPPIDAPTIQLYYAVPVSQRARTDAVKLLATSNTTASRISDVQTQVGTFASLFDGYGLRLTEGRQLAGQLTIKINDLMQTLPANPINYPILYPMLLDAIGVEEQFRQMSSDVSTLSSRLQAVGSTISERSSEVVDLKNSLEYALSAPALPSQWTTRAINVSGADGRYVLSQQGRSFPHPYTEIEGEFEVARLTITNLVSPNATIGTTASQDIRFEAERNVNDPVLGLVNTIGTHDLRMTYHVTANIEDNPDTLEDEADPLASRDYFSIPYLGINLFIFEEDMVTVIIKGRYDSPLRVTSIEVEPGSTGGSIELMVPEPRSCVLLFLAVLMFAPHRRQWLNWHRPLT